MCKVFYSRSIELRLFFGENGSLSGFAKIRTIKTPFKIKGIYFSNRDELSLSFFVNWNQAEQRRWITVFSGKICKIGDIELLDTNWLKCGDDQENENAQTGTMQLYDVLSEYVNGELEAVPFPNNVAVCAQCN